MSNSFLAEGRAKPQSTAGWNELPNLESPKDGVCSPRYAAMCGRKASVCTPSNLSRIAVDRALDRIYEFVVVA